MNKALLLCLIALAFCADLDIEKFREDILTRHNYYRAQHQVGKLSRLSDLESIAQSWAENNAQKGDLIHSSNKYNGNYIGENLLFGYKGDKFAVDLVDVWYNEYPNYDFNNPGWTYSAGHFTQVVWKGSTYIGCGVKCKSDNSCYVCCNYYPAGNYINDFENNVFPKSTQTSETTEEDTTTNTDTTNTDTTNTDTTNTDTTNTDTTNTDTTNTDTTNTDSSLEKFREATKNRHNELRAAHQVGNLERDALLEKLSLENAKEMVEKDDFIFNEERYSDGKYIGQNLFWSYEDANGKGITDMWYGEVDNYNFNNPGFYYETGSFTQVVWKNSKKIGCAYACKDKSCYGSCMYYPAGNVYNQFSSNVLPKK